MVMFGDNIEVKVKDNVAIVTMKLDVPGTPSKTGKSRTIATSHGNHLIPGTDISLGINAYRKA